MSAILDKIKAGATVVDVRTPEEFADGSYPGALNIPVQDMAQRAGEIPRDKPVVVFCASGARSAFAARLLKTNSWSDVTNGGGLRDMPR
jgi:rhodanese-related sulfurtransferase